MSKIEQKELKLTKTWKAFDKIQFPKLSQIVF